MSINELKTHIADELRQVSQHISYCLESDIDLLNETNRSILSHSGKMLRPVLSILTAKICGCGKVTEDTIRFAAASEILHNATLFHDDVADNSSSRRGAPTVMSLLGCRASVLLGDYWLVKALEQILSADYHKVEVISLFSSTLGHLAEGEMLQLQKSRLCDTTECDYYTIIYNKTASLFETAAVSAAISVKAAKEVIDSIREYAINLGIAFQIKDDIFDYIGDSSIGKPVGIDLKEKKITLPLLGAFQICPKDEELYIRKRLCDIDAHPEFQNEIIDFINKYRGIDYATLQLNNHIDKAKNAIRNFPEGTNKDCLIFLAEYVADRKL